MISFSVYYMWKKRFLSWFFSKACLQQGWPISFSYNKRLSSANDLSITNFSIQMNSSLQSKSIGLCGKVFSSKWRLREKRLHLFDRMQKHRKKQIPDRQSLPSSKMNTALHLIRKRLLHYRSLFKEKEDTVLKGKGKLNQLQKYSFLS